MNGLKGKEDGDVPELIEFIIQQLEGLNHRQDFAEGPNYCISGMLILTIS